MITAATRNKLLHSSVAAIALWTLPAIADSGEGHAEAEYQQTVVLPASNRDHSTSGSTLGSLSNAAALSGCPNPVACENLLSGNAASDWRILEPGDASIHGFATDQSVNVGATCTSRSEPAAAYHIDIYRAGWYQGNGARKLATACAQPRPPQTQPACRVDTSNTTGLIDCGNWAESASWTVPARRGVRGVFRTPGAQRHRRGELCIFFNVRNDASTSAIVYQTSDTTRAAYNNYGGNSLYSCTVSLSAGHPTPV